MPSANIVNGMQMLVQKTLKIVTGVFFLLFWFWTPNETKKNIVICRKTCTSQTKCFPFKPLEDEFTIIVSVKAASKDLSSF